MTNWTESENSFGMIQDATKGNGGIIPLTDSEFLLTQGKFSLVNFLYFFIHFKGNFINDKKNGVGIYVSKNSSNKIVGNFKDNQINGLSVILKENDFFETGQICIMENGKSIPCTNESEKKNLKLHQQYKDLKTFYETNSKYIGKIVEGM